MGAAIALIGFASACGPSEERASDLALHAAIEGLRSGRGDRRTQIAAVQSAPAHTVEGQDAQRACVLAYTELSRAQEKIDILEPQVSRSKDRGGVPEWVTTELAAAEALLAKAKAHMPACDAAAARLAAVAR